MREIASGAASDMQITDHAPSPEDLVLERELMELIGVALRDLPTGQRAAVWLYYLGDYSVAHTAATLHTTPGAIKARLHAARCSLRNSLSLPTDSEEAVPMPNTADQLVEMTVVDVRSEAPTAGATPPRHVIVLREAEGERMLPIWTGPSEARQLAFATINEPTERPMTYTLMHNLLNAAGATITEVRVTSLADHTLFASVVVTAPPGAIPVDARPSDAINIALRTGAPIYASGALLDTVDTNLDTVSKLPRTAADIVAAAKREQQEAMRQIVEQAKRRGDPSE
jgi:bifunctional DNase/RNase